MAKNEALGRTKDARQDEFYTQLADIENELGHYRPHFKGKTVLCDCDDPYESNFFKCFALNFNKLRLKKLIATCYSGSPITGMQLPLFGESGHARQGRLDRPQEGEVHHLLGHRGAEAGDNYLRSRSQHETVSRLIIEGLEMRMNRNN